MPEVIEIQVPIEEIAARKERVAKAKRFEPTDRVPVWPAINYRFLLPQIGVLGWGSSRHRSRRR